MEANIRFIRALTNGGECCAILSEEEEIIQTGTAKQYSVIMRVIGSITPSLYAIFSPRAKSAAIRAAL
ncbi:hypothetical protein [Hymenobacter ginkgonis]|uniref:hypothetical protein n=1 Tax=Hymenobacter ginkgonis TaxID=2682976 RepID=UPI00293BB782|nr:hypothetical protein [Hymenobacter ginkgonis]